MKSPKNKPEDICKCLHAGTLSECFGGTTISMRVQRQSVVSCFIRHPDGRVTCPMGQELFRASQTGAWNGQRKPGSPPHLPQSLHRLAQNKAGEHRAKQKHCRCAHVRPPESSFSSCRRAFSLTTAWGGCKSPLVWVILRRNPEDMQRRKEPAEHPFGMVKWYDGALFFLCREKEMVRTEMALSLLGYNLRRAINLLGAGALVAHFNARNRKNRE